MPSTPTRGAATWALLSLALGSFGIGMTEFVSMGLLPDIARDVLADTWGRSQEEAIGQAGLLISLYALGVVVGAPTIAGLTARFARHRVLLALALALALFNGIVALMPDFASVGLARFLAGLPHGVYFGVGALVAAEVMGPGNRAKGVAFVLTGLTVANVIGVPAGTFLGQHFGWRIVYVIVGVIFALAALLIALFVPAMAGQPGRTLRDELRIFTIPQVWFALGIGAIGFGGFFAVYSYIAPMVTELAGLPTWSVAIFLVVFGLGMTLGNVLGGHFADIDLKRTLFLSLSLLSGVLVLLAFTASIPAALGVLLFLVGVLSAILSPTIQTRLMDVAGDNQAIGAALNHSSLNIGNSLGAFLGGVTIAAGLGYASPVWAGVVLTVIGIGIAAVSYRVEERTRRSVAR